MTATARRLFTKRSVSRTRQERTAAQPSAWRYQTPADADAVAAERQLARISRDSAEALLCTDPFGCVLAANPAAGVLFDVEARWLMGKPIAVYVPLTARRTFRIALAAVVRDQSRVRWVQTMQDRQGRAFEASIAVSVTGGHGDGGPLIQWLIRDRRAGTSDDDCVASWDDQDHLWRLDLLGSRTAMAVHDLCQPLAALRIYLDRIRALGSEAFTAEDLDDVVGRMHDQVARATDLLENLRELARRRAPIRKPTDLGEVLRSAIRLCAPHAPPPGCLELVVEGRIPPVWGNATELEQVFVNLVLNALRAVDGLPPDRRHVAVVARVRGGMVDVLVQDRGRGLGNRELALCTAFAGTRTEGLGLGLAICRKIIEGHGGRIWAPDVCTAGCEIRVLLPTTNGEAT